VTLPEKAIDKTNRTLLSMGATGTLLGIALSTGEQPAVGGAVTLLGLAVTIYGLHRFGRSGSGAARPKRRRAKAT
jgi:hypothetical protein